MLKRAYGGLSRPAQEELCPYQVLCMSGESGPGSEDKPSAPGKISTGGRNRYSSLGLEKFCQKTTSLKTHMPDCPARHAVGEGLACRFTYYADTGFFTQMRHEQTVKRHQE